MDRRQAHLNPPIVGDTALVIKRNIEINPHKYHFSGYGDVGDHFFGHILDSSTYKYENAKFIEAHGVAKGMIAVAPRSDRSTTVGMIDVTLRVSGGLLSEFMHQGEVMFFDQHSVPKRSLQQASNQQFAC